MTLNWPLRPAEGQSSFYRLVIFVERLRKAREFREALLFHLFQPRIKAFPLALSQHGRKFLDQEIGLSDLLIPLAQLRQVLLLPLQALIFLKGDPMSHL